MIPVHWCLFITLSCPSCRKFWLHLQETFNVKTFPSMLQTVIWCRCVLVKLHRCYSYSKTKLYVPTWNKCQARLRLKNNSWEVAKKFVESYSLTNVVERNPGKKVQAKKLTAKHWPYYIVAELSLARAQWVSKSTHPRKFGNHVTGPTAVRPHHRHTIVK